MTTTVQTGDTVVYSKYAGTEVALEGTDYVLLKVSGEAKAHLTSAPTNNAQQQPAELLHRHAGGGCDWCAEFKGADGPPATRRPSAD